ncbi:hypothetical protein DSECCO2_635750 [anaerobic digester metagenome]
MQDVGNTIGNIRVIAADGISHTIELPCVFITGGSSKFFGAARGDGQVKDIGMTRKFRIYICINTAYSICFTIKPCE